MVSRLSREDKKLKLKRENKQRNIKERDLAYNKEHEKNIKEAKTNYILKLNGLKNISCETNLIKKMASSYTSDICRFCSHMT